MSALERILNEFHQTNENDSYLNILSNALENEKFDTMFEKISFISYGKFSAVYKAKDISSGEIHTIKKIAINEEEFSGIECYVESKQHLCR